MEMISCSMNRLLQFGYRNINTTHSQVLAVITMHKLKRFFSRRLDLGDMTGVAVTVMIIGVIVAMGVTFMDKMEDNVQNNTTAQQYINDISTSFGTFADWMPIIVLIVVASIVIGILVRSFGSAKVTA
jgi:hypothetical protein